MKDFEQKLDQFKESDPLSLFYKFGTTPDEIKLSIIDSFNKYFQNIENLKEFSIKGLVGTWSSYLTVKQSHPEIVKFIEIILDIFNEAKQVDKNQTIEIYLKWVPEFNQSISRFWSMYNTQENIQDLCIEDFLEVILNNIGKSIEGLLKPYLKLILHLNRVKRNKLSEYSKIQSKDLGVIIDELINTSNLNELLIIEPNSIRLNQWRNISYHHNTKIISGQIFYFIKRNDIIEEFQISKPELLDIFKLILSIFKIIRISETIFFLDNIDYVQEYANDLPNSQVDSREESKLLDFYSSISSQGFRIKNLKYDSQLAMMDIEDMIKYDDFRKRAIHSSQILYNFWIFTQSSHLIINYSLSSGEKFFTSEINSNNFIKYSGVDVELSELLKDVQFTFIDINFSQNEDPFEQLILSPNIKNHPQIFYSQQDKRIPIEEFIRQFSLTVFCNYLVLESEGFQNIKINIGSDGSLIIAKKNQKIILNAPAKIENKLLQLKLIDLLDNLVDLYEKKKLKYEIISEAKNSNMYYQKKIKIKEQFKTNK